MLGIIIILLIPPSQVPPLLVPQELEEGHIIHPRSSRFLHLFCLLVITLPAAGVPKKVKKEGIALLSLLLPQSPEISHNESIFNLILLRIIRRDTRAITKCPSYHASALYTEGA